MARGEQNKPGLWERIKAQLIAPVEPLAAYVPFTVQERKALYDLHPELADRIRLGASYAGETWVSPTYPYSAAITDYDQNVWMRKAVKLVSDAIAPLPIETVQGEEPIDNAPATQLLNTPNVTQSPADLWREWTVDMMLGGETGLEIVGNKGGGVAELWGRWPSIFVVVPDAANKRYRLVAGYIIDDQESKPYTLTPDEFIHFKFVNPRNRWRGVSPFIANRIGLRIDKYARDWSEDFFRNGTLPAVAVTTPTGTTKSERDALLAEVLAVYRGSQNGVIVLEEGVTSIEPISHPPKDVSFVEQRNMSRDEVGAAAGIPDILMGFGNDSYDTPDKRTNAEATMWNLTIKPLVEYRDQVLTAHFRRIRLLTDAQEIKTNLSGVAALKENYGQQLDNATKLWNLGVPFNVIDDKLQLGIGTIPDGDKPKSTGGFGNLLPPPEDEPDDEDGPEDDGDGDELEQRFIQPRRKSINTGMVLQRSTMHTVDMAYGGDWHRAVWGEWVKRTDPHERRIGVVVARLFERIRRDVLARVNAQKMALAVATNGHVRAIQKSITDIAEDPFDRDEWTAEARKAIKPELRRTVADAGRRALADVGVGIAFDLLDPNVTKFLREREQRFAKRVTETTWQMLKDTLSSGIEAGEGIPELAARVDATMDLRANQSSTAIARTETIGASAGGSEQAWKQTDGLVSGKVWIATLDDRVRETHEEAHGDEVALDEDFEVGDCSGPGPGQIDCAEESVNCRCAIAPVVED